MDDFGWFTEWVDQRLGVCLTFARGLSREQLLERFAVPQLPAARGVSEETFDEAADDPSRPKVRVGEAEGWAYAVEHITPTPPTGAEPRTLRRVSVGGGEAFSLSHTLAISAFTYAADGEYVCGFDLVVPHIRWGSDPHRFDATMEEAGFLRADARDRAPARAARFVRLAFGITVTREMLELPLPSFRLD